MLIKTLAPRALKQRIKRELALKNPVLVGTHHKTGTVWMQKIFGDICRRYGLTMVGRKRNEPPPDQYYDIFFHAHSEFPDTRSLHFRGLHLIRDPRDLIVSAAFYHQKSEEGWLHIKQDKFGGLTYQEKINTYTDMGDKLLFEMENSSYDNIQSIKNWDYDDARFINVKYENIIDDRQLTEFERIFNHLGFRDHVIGWCMIAAYRNSLFSGAARSEHVRSGKSRQWPNYFGARQKERFDELFGDVLARTGYDDDGEWIKTAVAQQTTDSLI